MQLERLKRQSGEEIARLKKEAERSKGENQERALKAEAARLQTEEEARQQTLSLSKQLEELHMEQEIKVCDKEDLCSAPPLHCSERLSCQS